MVACSLFTTCEWIHSSGSGFLHIKLSRVAPIFKKNLLVADSVLLYIWLRPATPHSDRMTLTHKLYTYHIFIWKLVRGISSKNMVDEFFLNYLYYNCRILPWFRSPPHIVLSTHVRTPPKIPGDIVDKYTKYKYSEPSTSYLIQLSSELYLRSLHSCQYCSNTSGHYNIIRLNIRNLFRTGTKIFKL